MSLSSAAFQMRCAECKPLVSNALVSTVGLSPSFTAQTFVLTDFEKISNFAKVDLPIDPMLGFYESSQNRIPHRFQIIGTQGSEVWLSNVEDSVINLTRLGHQLDPTDRRLRGVEDGILGSHIVLAFERNERRNEVLPRVAVEAFVQSGNRFYNIRKLSDESLAIERVGYVQP